MRNILHRGPRFAAFLLLLPALVFVLSLLWQIVPAPAQTQTFQYIGPAWSISDCQGLGLGVPPCTNGSVAGFVALDGVASNFSGTVNASHVSSYALFAGGVPSMSSLSDPNPSSFFSLSSGQVTGAVWQATHATATADWQITTTQPSYDSAYYRDDTTGTILSYGFVNPTNGIWIGPKSFGIACNAYHSGAGSCGEPIDLGSGNVFDQVTDYETAGQNKLSLIRYYNSMETTGTSATSMGVGWRTNYDRFLHVYSYGIVAERPDGQQVSFTSSSGTYTPDSDIDLALANPSGSTWTLTDRDDTVETYTVAGSLGTLDSIKLRNKYTQALTYSSSQISYVSDSYTRQLGFSYSSAGLLTGVTTPDSLTLTYGYVTYSSADRLTTVTYNTSPTTSLTYLYENTSYPYALTGITDENGNRYATWGYDGYGRGILSQFSGAVYYTSVYYDDATGDRVVKGPLGIVETYKFTTLQGVPKVTEIDRAANGSVAFASQGFTYDSNGYTASKTDWNRNITAWTNNSHGLPTQIVYASTTTNAQTANLTYDLSWPHLQHTVATQGLTENFTYSSSGNLLTDKLRDLATASNTRLWTYTYNGTGQLLTAQSPRSDLTAITTYGYTGGTLTSITDALSHVTTINTATGGGLPKKITDPNSVHTTIAYNNRNWPTSSVLATSAGNLTTSFTYDSAGNLTKTTLPDNSYLSYGYDNAHRPNSITNVLSESAAITYDSAGDVTQTLWKSASNVTKRQHTATFDALGRMLTDVGGQSQTASFTYDNNGNVISITDP
jgi:YD repeat-containing protein